MDSFKLHNAIQDDADDEDLYIPSTVDKGKNKAEEMSFLMPSPASVNQMHVDMPVPQHQHDKLDLAYSIKGMYRILDLITERGGGGLVDKIIISQDSVKAFINTVSPGAYVSVTKVDFKALDNYIIKPVGVYGSKEEIVRFLSELGVVDGAIATQLLVDTDTPGPTKPTLRSGLYIISNIEQAGNTRQTFLLYWPEEGTWDDSAASSVRRNPYLMKMCDQVVALISSEHAQTIIWNEDDRDRDRDVVGVDQRESARMFTFEVAQTNEQEESVTGLLDQQVVTHRAAGEFLHMMKTLMAKLKAQLISMLLPNALAFGLAEIDPEREPLKVTSSHPAFNSTDGSCRTWILIHPVELPDTPDQLFIARGGVGQSTSAETTLADLRTAWDQYQFRQYAPEEAWIEELCNHLEGIVSLRIAHVREWLDQNLSRFQAGHASINELRRNFEDAIVDLKGNVQLCKLQCASCQLLCVQSRLHKGSHHCQTDHFCVHECNFCMELSGEHKRCTMTAGHAGKHMQARVPRRMHQDENISALLRALPPVYVRSKQRPSPSKPLSQAETKLSSTRSILKVRSSILAVDSLVMFIGAVARRSKCIKLIPPGATMHIGHPQQEHETRHGSMSRTRWTVDGPDDVALEIEGRKFSTNDEGAPMMCNLVCQAMGRHVHIDYCRADDEASCTGNDEIQHLTKRLLPNPDREKDALTHNLFWKRSGFKDPYSKEEQAYFAKCDAMCSGPEHSAASGNAALPSYCVVMQQAFHVIFVADRSGSMLYNDRRPLANTPATARISARSNNRFGAVLSSLYSFWTARAAAVAGSHAARRDAYSVILFDHTVQTPIVDDFASTPDQLLDTLLPFEADGGTNFTIAIQQAQAIMEQSWSTERSPVIIFLSDGKCSIADVTMQDLCRTAVRLGKAVSFHSVSFGSDGSSTYLRRMAEIARDAQNNAPRDPLTPAAATVQSSYTRARDTVQLAETFLVIAESLRKPRGALLH
ncbi:hypothetical protein BU15DRAFT_68421 [Melanogaster broomeanus]|nr:hypothetical protein BU15DRAFT_68421 [Melanogaster broomeanus]